MIFGWFIKRRVRHSKQKGDQVTSLDHISANVHSRTDCSLMLAIYKRLKWSVTCHSISKLRKNQESSAKVNYFLSVNNLSAMLWTIILALTFILYALYRYENGLYMSIDKMFNLQTLCKDHKSLEIAGYSRSRAGVDMGEFAIVARHLLPAVTPMARLDKDLR